MMSVTKMNQPASRLGKHRVVRCEIQVTAPDTTTNMKILNAYEEGIRKALAQMEVNEIYPLQLALTVDEVNFK